MTVDAGYILFAGTLLALGIGAALVAGRLRVPGLVLFLLLGMLIGSDGLGLIDFQDVELAQQVGVVALALILFEGGLTAGWIEIRPVLGTSLLLAGPGTVLTAAVAGLAAAWLLDLSVLEGLLLGSIVATTDSAAVFAVLRGSALRRRLARVLEGESGLNDPIAVLLVVSLIDWIRLPDYGVGDMAALLGQNLAIGAVVGIAAGQLALLGLRRLPFVTGGLYPVATLATAAIAFGGAEAIHGSGFLAVYLAGLALGGARVQERRTLEDFHASLGWVSQIAVFLTLGLLVNPSGFADVALEGLALAVVLALVARPLAALLATRVGGFSWREGLMIGWAGLRGAIPIVLATFPVVAGVDPDREFFDLVFFVVLTSTLVQGATVEPLARLLGVTSHEPAHPRPLVEVATIRQLGAEVVEYPVRGSDAIVGHVVNELGLPREALVSVIVRGNEALLPRGSTVIERGDRLHILTREAVRREVEALFERWKRGPIGEPEVVAAAPLAGRAQIFTTRPWRARDGDPAAPADIDGVLVLRRLRTRRGAEGALVVLEDGRFAVTGDGVVAVGGPRQLLRWTRARIARATEPESRAWWQEVAGVVSQRSLR